MEEQERIAGARVKIGKTLRALAYALSPRALSPGRKIGLGIGACCLVVVALVGVLGSADGSTAKQGPPPAAQSLTLPALGRAGAHVSLNQYRGRAVMVNFFASWCTMCKQETPLLARFYLARRGQVPVIGVDENDGTGAAEKFTKSDGVAFPIGTDPVGLTATRWGVVAIPQTFFLNASHHIVKRVFGALTQADLDSGLTRMRSK
jgi:thiol-disulfide isomerase/thioredoxin